MLEGDYDYDAEDLTSQRQQRLVTLLLHQNRNKSCQNEW